MPNLKSFETKKLKALFEMFPTGKEWATKIDR